MRSSTRLLVAALFVIGLAHSSSSMAAPNARPAKVGKSHQARTPRPIATTAGARRQTTKLKTKPAQTLRTQRSLRATAKKSSSEKGVEIPAYAVKLREALGQAIEANLKKFPGQADFIPADRVLYHSVRETAHRELWKGKYEAQGVGMIGEWMTGGRYGGIWTTSKKVGNFGGEGWYSDKGSPAVRITLKKNAKFIDLDDPVQKQIYKDWQKLSGQDKQPSPKDLFQTLKNADGTPLAKRVSAFGAPTHGDFLVHMGVAGVIHYDTYGQGNPVLINPHAIERVDF